MIRPTSIDITMFLTRLESVAGYPNTLSREPPNAFSRKSSTYSLPPTISEDVNRVYYVKLVKDGGRPIFLIEDLSNILEEPEAYYNIAGS